MGKKEFAMNEVIQTIMARKSIRAYEPREIEPEQKGAILQAALRAPTAGNMSLYTILDITDQSLKERLSETCDHQPFIGRAPMVLVFCVDYYRWYHCFRRLESEDYPVRKPDMGDFLLAFEDVMAAAQTAVLAAESLGIGSCYIGDILENYEIHQELLKLPQYVAPVSMLVFGYPMPGQAKRKQTPRFRLEDMVHENGYCAERADRMYEMIKEREGKAEEEMEDYLRAFCTRKWNSDFSVEMSRSANRILEAWKRIQL